LGGEVAFSRQSHSTATWHFIVSVKGQLESKSMASSNGTAPIRVIYVEDSQLQADLLQAGLAIFNIDVLHLATGDETLIEELSQSYYDDFEAIILDVKLGDLTGLQVARRLRAMGDSRGLLLISSEDRPPASELMAVQAVFISKPFDFDKISDTIKKLTAHF
jgi:DNA-binding response OmpR family regulator